jgi:hypothetical protein
MTRFQFSHVRAVRSVRVVCRPLAAEQSAGLALNLAQAGLLSEHFDRNARQHR